MKKEKHYLYIGTILIAVTILGCMGFSYLTRLKEPVFLTYCMAVRAGSSPSLGYTPPVMELQYLTNRLDNREVTGISFPEAPEYDFTATENEQYNGSVTFFHGDTAVKRGETIGRYSLRKVYVYMNNYYVGDWVGEMELNHALVAFNDGSTREIDLGEILIYSDAQEVPALDMTSSGYFSQGVRKTTLSVREGLVNLRLESPLLDEVVSGLELTVNSLPYKELEALELKRGDTVIVEYTFTDASRDGYDVYDVRPRLCYTREDKSQGFVRIYDIKQTKYFFSYWDSLKYLIRRGAF